jgi:hypothetical protein
MRIIGLDIHRAFAEAGALIADLGRPLAAAWLLAGPFHKRTDVKALGGLKED